MFLHRLLNLPIVRGALEIPRLLFALKVSSFSVEGALVSYQARAHNGVLQELEEQLL